MRVDLFLKYVCLVKSRSRAHALCEDGAVTINARTARPSAQVRAGDRLELVLPERKIVIEVERVPAGQLSRSTGPETYSVVLDERTAGEEL